MTSKSKGSVFPLNTAALVSTGGEKMEELKAGGKFSSFSSSSSMESERLSVISQQAIFWGCLENEGVEVGGWKVKGEEKGVMCEGGLGECVLVKWGGCENGDEEVEEEEGVEGWVEAPDS